MWQFPTLISNQNQYGPCFFCGLWLFMAIRFPAYGKKSKFDEKAVFWVIRQGDHRAGPGPARCYWAGPDEAKIMKFCKKPKN